MKKLLFLCLALMLCLTACGKKQDNEEIVEPEPVEQVENVEPEEEPIENTVGKEIETAEALEEKAGFVLEGPEAIEGADKVEYLFYDTLKLAEINYLHAGEVEEEVIAYARKMKIADLEGLGDASITGVSEEFSTVEDVDGYKVSSEGDLAYMAEWQDEEFVYCMVFMNGVPQETLLAAANLVK